ncbi:MAG TPA: DNA alkylation repair protein [Pirellulales bacterium]|jgi:3-methyladenine DNA glycosylase AlkD
MATLKSVMAKLKSKASDRTRATYVRHGAPADRAYGVRVADLKVIAKSIRRDQQLAQALFGTGNFDAMYLAGLVADGSQMSQKVLDAWAEGADGLPMISEYTVPWAAVESPHARQLALKWIKSKRESVAACGWCTYAGIVATTADNELDLAEVAELLAAVVKNIRGAQNRVRYTMNGFVISVGAYVKPLLRHAKATAQTIGTLSIDMGETACKVPLATAYIEKIEALGRVGKKRKTIRC